MSQRHKKGNDIRKTTERRKNEVARRFIRRIKKAIGIRHRLSVAAGLPEACWFHILHAVARPPVRAITRGPKTHWFGYYDKLQFDPTGRFVLANQVGFEHRSPRPNDCIKVGMVDTAEDNRWIELGESRAWNWQQGCMLQWIPGSDSEVIWNDREDGRFVSHILDVSSGKRRTLPNPIYCLSNDGSWALAPDFRRLNDCRPGYGYTGIPDPNFNVLAPENAGIWKMDLRTGEQRLLLSFADIVRIPHKPGYSEGAKHWFNHLLVAPGDQRFVFLHRWRGKDEENGWLGWKTRMLTAGVDGKDVHVLIKSGNVSHFIWRDGQHILCFSALADQAPLSEWRFYLFQDRTGKAELVEGMPAMDGHCTYLPDGQWILCDTYPDKRQRQNPYLMHLPTRKRNPLGHFLSPPRYHTEWRCDLHPRCSPDGRTVAINSGHGGNGRQLYLIDIGGIVGKQ